MRKWNWLTVVTAVGSLAGPSLGIVNMKLTADGPVVGGQVQLAAGAMTTVRLWAQGTSSGIWSVAGDIVANGTNGLLTSNSFAWVPEFYPTFLVYPKNGSPGPNGGWTDFGSEQTNVLVPDPTYGKADYVQVASYTVTANSILGAVTLYFGDKKVDGFATREVGGPGPGPIIGTVTSVAISVPEPVSLALLAVGGLLVGRRRRS